MAGHLAVLGGGPLARAAARIMARSTSNVRLWARRPEIREALGTELTGIELCAELSDAAADAATVFFAIPSDGLADVAERYGDCATGDQVVLLASRGVGPNFALPHETVRAKTCVRKIGVMGGPIHAQGLDAGHWLNAVVASTFPEVAHQIRRLVEGTPIAVHASQDVVGLEVTGAISHVAAIAAGMATREGFGETARALLIAHGLADAKRLGVALGASATTFGGLAGLGELIPRQTASSDRHTALGVLLAEGRSLDEALAAVDGRVEGVLTTREARSKGAALGLELPLVDAVDSVFAGDATVREALRRVLYTGIDLEA